MIGPAEFREACDQLCREYGLWQTSGRRTDQHSLSLPGGFSHDPHSWGAAVDCLPVLQSPVLDRFVERARALLVRAMIHPDHLHLQPLDWPAGPVFAAPDPQWEGLHT